jgi:PKD repeat protein
LPVTFRPLRRRRDRSRGQSLVEIALVAPVFLLLLLTAIDLGRLLYSQITISNAAKEGALVASQGGTYQANQGCSDANTVMCGALTEAKGGFVEVDQTRVTLTPATCVKDATYPSSGAPPNVIVNVTAPFRVVTPIIGSIVGSNLVLGATAQAQCLVVPKVTFPAVPAPNAAFTYNPASGNAPLTVNFDASSSTAVNATISSYSWSFGGTGVTTSHQYTTPGSYTVVLTITDSRGQTDTATATINVSGGGGGPTPTPTVSCPTIDFTATDNHNNGHPHRMTLTAALTPSSNGWTYTWTGAWTTNPPNQPTTGQSVNVDFNTNGQQSVSVTAVKGSCTVTKTKMVTAP